MNLSRRTLLAAGLATPALLGVGVGIGALIDRRSAAAPAPLPPRDPLRVEWDDLIPPGVPYAEIIGEGEMDVLADTWKPVFDANGTQFNPVLDGAFIRMPGYIIPMAFDGTGVSEFLLVPYVGACIHTPPPPPNQLVYVEVDDPWPSNQLWDAVWVTGEMRAHLTDTHLAEAGYAMAATEIEVFRW
ncbi:MAG: DUF3299 domain-containing protein [Pseudomonadota bacterium]